MNATQYTFETTVRDREPTARLMWKDGTLVQLFTVTYERKVFLNGSYSHTETYVTSEWQQLPRVVA